MEKDEMDEKKRPLIGLAETSASKRPRRDDYSYGDVFALLQGILAPPPSPASTTTEHSSLTPIPLPLNWDSATPTTPSAKLNADSYAIDPHTAGPWLTTQTSALRWFKATIAARFDPRKTLTFERVNRTKGKPIGVVLATKLNAITKEQRALLSPTALARLSLIQSKIELANQTLLSFTRIVEGRYSTDNSRILIVVIPYVDTPQVNVSVDSTMVQTLLDEYYRRLDFFSNALKKFRSSNTFVWYTDRSYVSEQALRALLQECDADVTRTRVELLPLTDFWLDASFEDPYSSVLRRLKLLLTLGDFKRSISVVALPGYTTLAMITKAKKAISVVASWFQLARANGLVFSTLCDLDGKGDDTLFSGEEFLVGSQGSLGLVDSISGSDATVEQLEESVIGLFRPSSAQSLIDLKANTEDPVELNRLENLESILALFASEALYSVNS